MSMQGNKIIKGNKLRLYPTNDQIHIFMCMFGNQRFVWNIMLDFLDDFHKQNPNAFFPTVYDLNSLLPWLKTQFEFLKISDKSSFEIVNEDLVEAYHMFFKQVFSHPKKHFRKSNKLSYSGKRNGTNVRVIDKHHIKLPKVGVVCVSNTNAIGDRKIKRYTVTLAPSGKFFLSVNYECENQTFKKTQQQVGIDLNEHTLAVTSNGHVYPSLNVKSLEHKLAIEQRKLSRRYKRAKQLIEYDRTFKPRTEWRDLDDFKNYQRQKQRVARIHEKIRNVRNDYLQKITTQIVKDYDVIVVEDLHVKNLMKNHKNAHKLASQSWFEFRRELTYKCDWYGKTFVVVDPKNTSRICSNCHKKNHEFDTLTTSEWLATRKWTCPNCHVKHDRDVNAANNILNRGLAKLTH